MVMRANEAHKQAEEINAETYKRIIGQIDTGIENAAYNGYFTYTTGPLNMETGNKIIDRYEAYEYEVIPLGNHCYTINW